MPTTAKPTEPSPTPSSVEVLICRPAAVAEVWRGVAPLVRRILAHGNGEFTVSDVFDAVSTGRMDLWLGTEDGRVTACMLGEAVRYPQYRTYVLIGFAAEKLSAWLPHFPILVNWARRSGYRAIEERGRGGWLRRLKGWRRTHFVMRYDL